MNHLSYKFFQHTKLVQHSMGHIIVQQSFILITTSSQHNAQLNAKEAGESSVVGIEIVL